MCVIKREATKPLFGFAVQNYEKKCNLTNFFSIKSILQT